MRKLLILFVILSCCAASAQEKDFLDIDKLINNRIKKQPQTSFVIPRTMYKAIPQPPYSPGIYSNLSPDVMDLKEVLSNGNKVYISPHFHMPVIVPEMGQFNMPNHAHSSDELSRESLKKKPGKIPDPSDAFKSP